MTTTAKWILGIIIILIIIVGIGLLGTGTSERETIKIGVSAPLSGQIATFGQSYVAGAELAVKEINDAGGIDGVPLELVLADDQCSDAGREVVEELLEMNDIQLFIGPICSDSGLAVVPLLEAGGIPSIIIAANPSLTEIGKHIFRNFPKDTDQALFAAEYVYNELEVGKIAVANVPNEWGENLADAFVDRYEDLGGEVLSENEVVTGETDIEELVIKIDEEGSYYIYAPVFPQDGIDMVNAIAKHELELTVIGTDGFSVPELINNENSNGTQYVDIFINPSADFGNSVESVTGKAATQFSPYGYDAVKILESAIRDSGLVSADIVSALKRVQFTDRSNQPVSFDDDGNLMTPVFRVIEMNDGAIDVVYSNEFIDIEEMIEEEEDIEEMDDVDADQEENEEDDNSHDDDDHDHEH